jgi:hypothetical protein
MSPGEEKLARSGKRKVEGEKGGGFIGHSKKKDGEKR